MDNIRVKKFDDLNYVIELRKVNKKGETVWRNTGKYFSTLSSCLNAVKEYLIMTSKEAKALHEINSLIDRLDKATIKVV